MKTAPLRGCSNEGVGRPPPAAGLLLHSSVPARAPEALALARKNEGVGRSPPATGPLLRWNSRAAAHVQTRCSWSFEPPPRMKTGRRARHRRALRPEREVSCAGRRRRPAQLTSSSTAQRGSFHLRCSWSFGPPPRMKTGCRARHRRALQPERELRCAGRRRRPAHLSSSSTAQRGSFHLSSPWHRCGGAAPAHEKLPARAPLTLALAGKKAVMGRPPPATGPPQPGESRAAAHV